MATAVTSPFAMVIDFPLSRDSTAVNKSRFFSTRSASLVRWMPRCCGVTDLHGPVKAFRAADTARSTSFSVASWTEQITSSVVGLITSKVFLSTPSTNSLLINLERRVVSDYDDTAIDSCNPGFLGNLGSRHTLLSMSSSHLQASGLFVGARERRLQLN